MRLLWILLALMVGGTAPAVAEPCMLCAPKPKSNEKKAPRSMSIEIETSLDFDRVILVGESGGTARIGPDGSRSSSGAVGALSGRTMVGTVVVQGEPGRHIRVEVPKRIDLFGRSGGHVSLTDVVTDLGPSPRLDGSGRLTFHFGGGLALGGTAEGDYRGEIPITVDYF